MPYRSDVVYCFDGSFDGLMCCVYECFLQKELPCAVITECETQNLLFDTKTIETNYEISKRAETAISSKISFKALNFVKKGFMSCEKNKDLLIVKFLLLGFHYGKKIMSMLTNDTVDQLSKAVMHVTREAHNYLGFVRFSSYNGFLYSTIEPKNQILPLIAPHFTQRFPNENFVIFDKPHHTALCYTPSHAEIIFTDNIITNEPDEQELLYRNLWKEFYNAIGIHERKNPKQRMTMMPKRYWANLTEFMP